MNGSGTASTTKSSLEMMLINSADASMTVLERQRARFKWQHLDEVAVGGGLYGDSGGGLLGEVVAAGSWKPDPVGWYASCEDGGFDYNGIVSEVNYAGSRTSSSLEAEAKAVGQVGFPVKEKAAGIRVGRESSKKRTANNEKVVGEEEDCRDKRTKRCWGEDGGESRITDKSSHLKTSSSKKGNNNILKKEKSSETSKDNDSKITDVQKPDYIHVRARRGQATDSHSLAERVRREKISERMKYLQDLVPGCNKITGKAGMLDEIINYVQSLQRQVEFLSMKLAAVNPRIDINVDSLYPKEGFPPSSTDFSPVGMSPETVNAAYLQLNSLQQQIAACCGFDAGICPPDLGIKRTISAPVSVPETFIDSTFFNQLYPTAGWDADLQNLYNVAFDQGRSTSFPPQPPFTGQIDAGNLKM